MEFKAHVVREEMNDAGKTDWFENIIEITAAHWDAAKEAIEKEGFQILRLIPNLKLV